MSRFNKDATEAACLDQVDDALQDAVRFRLSSDVPVGAFLSGGIDSGLVAGLAARQCISLQTFTAAFPESGAVNDERPLARLVAKRYQTNHRELNIGSHGISLLPKLIYSLGDPLADYSVIPNALLAQAAKPFATVVLTGDGGDEFFGGYLRTIATYLGENLSNHIGKSSCIAGRKFLAHIRSTVLLNKVDTILKHSYEDLASLYVNGSGGFKEIHRAQMLRDIVPRSDLSATRVDSWIEGMDIASSGMSRTEAYMQLDVEFRLAGRYLPKLDIASSLFGVECRSPFLDHNVVELAGQIPLKILMKHGRQKALLRCLAGRYLPQEIATGKKQGFSDDLGSWFHRWGERLRAGFGEFRICGNDGPISGKFVEHLWAQHRSRRENLGEQLWCLLCLEIWWRLFQSPAVSPDDLCDLLENHVLTP